MSTSPDPSETAPDAADDALFSADGASSDSDSHGVQIIDTPESRIHHASDATGLVLSLLGIAVVIVLGIYAHGTTTGVTQDVQSVASIPSWLLAPVLGFEQFAVIILPAAVLIDMAIRRAGRLIIESVLAAVIAFLIGLGIFYGFDTWAPEEFLLSFRVWDADTREWVLALSPFIMALSALLTVSGRHGVRRSVTWSWNALWVALALSVLTSGITMLGALLVILVGRVVGLATRYAVGVKPERAYGVTLIRAIRQAGIDPRRITRVPVHPASATEVADPTLSSLRALGRRGDTRTYLVDTVPGGQVDVLVFDGDRQILGVLARWWRTLRLRALENRTVVSLRQLTERTALIGYTATAAGVRTPRILGIGAGADSMLIAQQHPAGTVSLSELPSPLFTDEVLESLWEQIQRAHKAGLTHRSLSADSVLVGVNGEVWLTGWDYGDVASADLAQRLDLAQALVMTALRTSPERAVAAASKYLDRSVLASIGPAIQSAVLPPETRAEAKNHKDVLDTVREATIAASPEPADPEPVKLTRSWRTALMVGMTILAVFVLVATINFDDLLKAVQSASPWWIVVSFGFVLVTYLGAALAFVGFSPIKLPVFKTTLVEVAASFVNFIAPAGVGPAALNLRFLTQRKVKTSLAVATVALVQVSGFVVTVVLLLVLMMISGRSDVLRGLPTSTIVWTVGIILAVIAILMLVPKVRTWILAKVMPTIQQVWPRLVSVLGEPKKLALGLGGNLLMTVGYLAAFAAALAAFGETLSPIQIGLIYLVGNTVGSLIPTPGGLGGVEAALVTALTTVGGIAAPIALSATMLFRVVSYWLRIPLGWFAMNYLQKREEI